MKTSNQKSEAITPVDVAEELNQFADEMVAMESLDEPTECSQLIQAEIEELEVEITNYKQKIKDAQKRIKELNKKPGESGPSKKTKILEWLTNNPSASEVEYLHYAVGELGISAVYAATIYKKHRNTTKVNTES